jgi:hypothetical protein
MLAATPSFSLWLEWSATVTSGRASRISRANSIPAVGRLCPARGNSTSEITPSTSSGKASNQAWACSKLVASRIFGRARRRSTRSARFSPSEVTCCECRSTSS